MKILRMEPQHISSQIDSHLNGSSQDFCALWIDEQFSFILKKQDVTIEKIRMIAGQLARTASQETFMEAAIDVETLQYSYSNHVLEDVIIAFSEGWTLGNYHFTKYKSKDVNDYVRLSFEGDKHNLNYLGEIRGESVILARSIANELSEVLTPETFPNFIKETFEESDVSVNVLNKHKIEELQMNGLLAVSKGSKYNPSFVEIAYKSNPDKPLIALVGKGVTYDSGGMHLKKGDELNNMRLDKSGAAAVIGAIKLLEKTNADVNVIGLIPIVENSIDQKAMKPSDVITYRNGLTVHIGDTDAEGRLILADALLHSDKLEAEYIIDIATLTYSIIQALGNRMAGVFGDDQAIQLLKQISQQNGDYVWQMPLFEAYEQTIKDSYADLSNLGRENVPDSFAAAYFLKQFVPVQSKWLHIDMAGTMEREEEEGYYSKYATGFGVRLLADFVTSVS